MSVNVDNIIRLANIKMEKDEVDMLSAQLNNIVGWVDSISRVNTDGVEPMYSVLQDLNFSHLQDGEFVDKVDVRDVLKNAPEVFETFITVPKVVDA